MRSRPSWRTGRTSTQRGYGYEWQQQRAAFLRRYPLCEFCRLEGRLTQATVVDHVAAHEGDPARFWDRSNWQPLCKRCHDSTKARIERSGIEHGCDASGMPIDSAHHWHEK